MKNKSHLLSSISRRDFISNSEKLLSVLSGVTLPMIHGKVQMPNTALCWLLVDVAMIIKQKDIISEGISERIPTNGTFFLKMIRTKAKQG